MVTVRDVYGSTLSALITGSMFLSPLLATLTLGPSAEDVLESYEPPVVTMSYEQLDLLVDMLDESEEPEPEPPAAEPVAAEPPAPLEDAPKHPVAKAPEAPAEEPAEAKEEAAEQPVAEARPKSAPSRGDRTKQRCGEAFPGVTKVADDSFHIDREVVDYYTASIARLNTLGYSRRYEEGEVKGWMVGGFGCKSPLWHGGLRARDVVQVVNGKKTNNVLQIFGLWAGQRNKDQFEVTVLRKGKLVTLHYTIV
jgi:hypothetical protein